MLIGFSIDCSDTQLGTGAILEELVSTFGFDPKIDLPLCLEYYDFYKVEEATQDLCANIFSHIVNGEPTYYEDEVHYNSVSDMCEVIILACKHINIDEVKLKGLEIILSDDFERILIWFNEEDVAGWKPQI